MLKVEGAPASRPMSAVSTPPYACAQIPRPWAHYTAALQVHMPQKLEKSTHHQRAECHEKMPSSTQYKDPNGNI